MEILVDIEDDKLDIRQKKSDGSNYAMQEIWVHTVDRNGVPNRYPERAEIFAPRNASGQQIPYPKGKYTIAPESFAVNRGRIELGYLVLEPVKKPS